MAREFIIPNGFKVRRGFYEAQGVEATEGTRLLVNFARRSKPAPNGRKLFGMREFVDAGVNKARLNVGVAGYGTTVTDADGIHAFLRRIRPQEAEELDAIDTEILALREKRKAVQERAWRAGHRVTWKELREWAEKREARREEERAAGTRKEVALV